MRLSSIRLLLAASLGGLACSPALSCALPSADDLAFTCHVTYAGVTHTVPLCPTAAPYDTPSVSIGGRFRFKAAHVSEKNATPRIGIYVYFEADPQPLLIQHVLIRPPYPSPRAGEALDLLGEQHVYAGPLERELIYHCTVRKQMP